MIHISKQTNKQHTHKKEKMCSGENTMSKFLLDGEGEPGSIQLFQESGQKNGTVHRNSANLDKMTQKEGKTSGIL